MNYDLLKNVYSFYVLNQCLNIKLKQKQSANIISGIHASCATFLSGIGDIQSLRGISTSYFIYDSLQMLYTTKIGIMEIAYLYHHLSAIYLLSKDSRQFPIRQIFFWAELSNLPGYPLYYYLHSNKLDPKVAFLKTMQKIMFVGIRIPIISQILISFYTKNKHNVKNIYPFIPSYLMGLIWSAKILNK
ncbi:hypothetical protein OAI84_00360 [bacterium]|nr:hypothetical protein [bacterium]